MKKKLTVLLSLTLALSTALVGCGTKKDVAEGGGGEKKVLNMLEADEIPALDSAKATDAISFNVLGNTMEGLYRLGENDKVEKGMADGEPTISADGLKYTFKIRDAKWSNGDAVTAKDFEYAWKRVLDPKTKSTYAYIMDDIKGAKEAYSGKGSLDAVAIKATDEKTLEVELVKPVPYFTKLLTFGSFLPLNQKFVEAQADKYALDADKAIYNGPFALTEWKHSQSWKMTKNDKYWDKDTVKLDEINTLVVKETSAGVNLYETNKLDRVGLTSEFINKYKDNKELGTRGTAALFFLRMNEKNEVLKNVNARKAINLAYDKKGITDKILNNGAKPANYFVPTGLVKDEKGEDFRKINGDMNVGTVADAQKLWETAKKELGKDKITLELLVSDTDTNKKISEFMKGELEKNLPGLTVNIKQQPFKQLLALQDKGEFDLVISGWSPDYPDPLTFLALFTSTSDQNYMGYSNPKYDELVKKAEFTADINERYQLFAQAEKIFMDDAAISPIFQKGTTFLQKPYVKNLYVHTFGADYSYKWTDIQK